MKTPHKWPPISTSRKALLVDGRDDLFRDVVDDLVRFAWRLQSTRELLAREMGVTAPQYGLLVELSYAPILTVSDLAERMRVSVPFVVTETRRLEEAGLISKRPDSKDRRRVNLMLTDKGRAAITAVGPVRRRVNDHLFGKLTRKDITTLHEMTKRLLEGSDAEILAAARRE